MLGFPYTVTKPMNFLDELTWRGMLHQTAGQDVVSHLSTPGRVAYCGFDPTADSLTVGNFIAIKMLMTWQRSGHKPIVVMGGGTGRIGDPSGRDTERQLLDEATIDSNIARQRLVLEKLLDFDPSNPNAAIIVNNHDWLGQLGYIEMLRDVGKFFSVNAMIKKDSVAERLNNREQGISYTEFSYMLLQAYDFLHLNRTYGCTVQVAGSDQYGNIVGGMDLIRRHRGEGEDGAAYGVTNKLLTLADGSKVGKSAGNAVWLSADRTSPYAFFQYWFNVDDADVIKFLRWFTFLDQATVESIEAEHGAAPHLRVAQRHLASEMTRMLHGADQLEAVENANQALFGGDVKSLESGMLDDVFADVPNSDHAKSMLGGEMASLVELLPQTALATSKRQAREFLQNGAVSVNGEKAGVDRVLSADDLLHGRTVLIRRGKKNWHALRWS
ncbi:MAG: tyrosine--tRNA ligase [Pseudomonadota bacterium]